ncbi:hypothetical protein BJ322DRAFT_540977 [Thelephora terrestris]|uniref:Uncharacterized protein n=1 Tax=Thelephora terrestris TaxID=56493 RepID=A0A9P6LA63_9AGAM|nr:hypothetical protein BJ322DRAFT_540977 [Thelephora terrestris]
MSATLPSPQNDLSSHPAMGYARDPLQVLQDVHGGGHPHVNTEYHQQLRQDSGVYHETQGDANARSERPTAIPVLPAYLQPWLDRVDSGDEEDIPSPVMDQDFMDGDDGHGYPAPEHSYYPLTEFNYVSQDNYVPTPAADDLPEDEVMAFASKYLNLDYGELEPANDAVEAEVASPLTSTGTSTSATGSPHIATLWAFERPSLSLFLDMTEFENKVDANGVPTENLWPWGDYVDRPPGVPEYFNPEAYAREYELWRLERKLAARIARRLAEEAMGGVQRVKSGRRRRRGGKRVAKGKEVRKGANAPVVVAFAGVTVRGRTIYNP